MTITFTVELMPDGQAVIRLPEGRTQKVDAAKLAALTQKLGAALGTITERHVGDHEHHVHHEHTAHTEAKS